MCTAVRFCDDKGGMYFGRNLDWSEGYGQKVVITPRGYVYNSAFLGTMKPQAGAIIGMAVDYNGLPLYFDCMNEAGLAIAGLNFPGYAAYEPSAVEGRQNVAAYEFPLWVTMNFKSVDEVEAALSKVAIVAKPVSDAFPVSELHYMIGDGKRSIVVEYTARGMEIFHNDVDVLTNQPGYGWHQENLRNYMGVAPEMPEKVDWSKAEMKPFGSGSLMRGLPGDCYSPSRFVRVAYHNTHYPTKSGEDENVSRLFHTLTSVAMVDGAAKMADGKCEITVYTGGCSATNGTYYYNTYEDPAIKTVKMGDYNLESEKLIDIA